MTSHTCPYCRRHFTPPPLAREPECPYCGAAAESIEPLEPARRSVARVSSLAEAGYFEDVLLAAGLEVVVHERDDFDALSGYWTKTYVLQVPEACADEAVDLLQCELAATDDRFRDADEQPSRKETAPDSPGSIAMALGFALLAGGLMLLGGRGAMEAVRGDVGHQRRGGPGGASNELWEALGELEAPLATAPVDGASRRRLSLDPKHHLIRLEEDLNGDGTFDRVRVFGPQGQLVEERQ